MIKELKKIKPEYADLADRVSGYGIAAIIKEIKAVKKNLRDRKYEVGKLQMYLSLLERELKKK